MADTLSPEFLALQSAVAGRYSLERELGRGGMGVVFLARDVALDRLVAIKLLPPTMAALPDRRERFLREARTAAKLSHPNIVPIFAVEEVGDLVFFAMAYVEGESVGDLVRKRGTMPPAAVARMLQETAWALAYAHLREVVHRDVKPDNILLEKETGRALVTDFGIAHAGAPSGLTAAGEIVGTAQYMSPEQACGEPLDGRSDLYSLGVVGYLALSGKLPFDSPDTAALLAMHITKPAPPLASVAPGIPGRLAQAIDRCLAKTPAERFPNGEALADAVTPSTALAKEVPAPIRVWLQRGEGAKGPLVIWSAMLGLAGIVEVISKGVPDLSTMVLLLGPLGAYAFYRAHYTQRVLSAGYTIADIRIALRERVQQVREELAFDSSSEPSLVAKAIRWATLGSFATVCASLLALIALPQEGWALVGRIGAILGTSLLFTIGGSLIGLVLPGRRIAPPDPAKSLRARIWNGRLGEWFAKLSGIGMKRAALPAAAANRPTEMAIGLAASALFESLPKEVRRSLPDLPEVLRRLEADAQIQRRRVDELGEAVASLGQESASGRSAALRAGGGDLQAAVAGQQEKLRADLTGARDSAARRLASAVAALENVRLDLLRLKAGAGTVDELSDHLTAARRLAEEIDLQVAGRAEVEGLLKRGGAREG